MIVLTRTRRLLNWLVQPLKIGMSYFGPRAGLIHFIGGGIAYISFLRVL